MVRLKHQAKRREGGGGGGRRSGGGENETSREKAQVIQIYCAQRQTHIFMSLIVCNIWSFEIYNNTPEHENLFLEDTCVMWAASKWLTLSV